MDVEQQEFVCKVEIKNEPEFFLTNEFCRSSWRQDFENESLSTSDIEAVQNFSPDKTENNNTNDLSQFKSQTLPTSRGSRKPVETSSLPLILHNEYFVIVEQRSNTLHQKRSCGVAALCQVCNAKISGSAKVTSNFLQHLKAKHPEVHLRYLQQKSKGREARKPLPMIVYQGSDDSFIEHPDSTVSLANASFTAHQKRKITSDSQADACIDNEFKQTKIEIDESDSWNRSTPESCTSTLETDEINEELRLLFDGSYFTISKTEQDNNRETVRLIAICKVCPSAVKIRSFIGCSANFINHLKTEHPAQYEEFKQKKIEANKYKQITKSASADFDTRLLQFLASVSLPLCIVENPAFIALFSGLGRHLRSGAAMAVQLDKNHKEYLRNIKEMLATAQYYCATTRLWSNGKRSVFGYTCHWIDVETLQRRSAALAFRRFKGAATSAKISELIASIHQEFSLDTTKLITTNATREQNDIELHSQLGITLYDSDGNMIEATSEEDETEFYRFKTMTTILPLHLPCVSDELNELATTDFLNFLKTEENLLTLHRECFARCSNLWYFSISSDDLKNTLSTPNFSHWRSVFECVKQLLQDKEKLSEHCQILNMLPFEVEHIEYLENFCMLITPIANALDFLQQEENLYFGYFIATLISIKVKLRKLAESKQLKHLVGACSALEICLLRRFHMFFKMRHNQLHAFVAAITCPAIKLRFCKVLRETAGNYAAESNLKQVLLRYADAFFASSGNDCYVKNIPQTLQFFDFDEAQSIIDEHRQSTLWTEIDNYFNDLDTSLCSLQRFPTIRQVFLKYNTPIPCTTAATESFTLSDMNSIPHPHILSDAVFEKLVLMRAGKNLI